MDIITEIEKQTFLINKSAACFPRVFFYSMYKLDKNKWKKLQMGPLE